MRCQVYDSKRGSIPGRKKAFPFEPEISRNVKPEILAKWKAPLMLITCREKLSHLELKLFLNSVNNKTSFEERQRFPCSAFIGLSVAYSPKKEGGGLRICFRKISKVSRQTYPGVHDEPQIVFPAGSVP